MMVVYKKEVELKEKLETSRLFRIMQDAAGEQCELTGPTEAQVHGKNLIWVIIRQYIEFSRYPQLGETLELSTWPGPMRHMFFPRFYVFKVNGEVIGQGSALWTLVDRDSRKMISPASRGIELEGLTTGEECRLPSAPCKLPMDRTGEYVVPAEVLDINGHMNNTRYYDLAESVFDGDFRSKSLCRAMTEYVSEALEGDRLHLRWGRDGDRYYITGTAGEGDAEKTAFRMSLEYK